MLLVSSTVMNMFRLGLFLIMAGGTQISFAEEPHVHLLTAQQQKEVELMREMKRTQMRSVVANSMKLSHAEREVFWPLYEDYMDDVKKLNDRFMALVSEYGEYYVTHTISDRKANKMMDEYFLIEKKKIKLKEKHIKKFRKVLPAKTVVRFFHIDTKLDAMNRVNIAQEVPLFPQE